VAIVKITGVGVPEDVLAAMAGRQLRLYSVPTLAPPQVALRLLEAPEPQPQPESEPAVVEDAIAQSGQGRLERLDDYETDLVTASRECSVSDRNILLDTAKALIPDKATVHKLFPRDKP
jgi:hypothetical protein